MPKSSQFPTLALFFRSLTGEQQKYFREREALQEARTADAVREASRCLGSLSVLLAASTSSRFSLENDQVTDSCPALARVKVCRVRKAKIA